MSFLRNFWFQLKTKRTPKLTDAKTKKQIKSHNQSAERLVQFLSQKKMPTLKQIKYVGKILDPREKVLIKIFLAIIAIALIFIGVNSFINVSSEIPTVGGEYTEGLIGAPQYINPVLAQTNDVDLDISSLLFDGLLAYDQDNGLVPRLAESIDLSEDQKTYTVVLKDNIHWHDGHEFNADDVVFTFDRIKDADTKSPLFFYFNGVSIEKVDERTIRFVLEKPFAPFIESLTTGILPEHIWSQIPPQNTNLSEFNIKPIGTGLFKFKSLTKDNQTGQIRSFVIERNEDYFDKTPYIKKITFKFYTNFEEAIDALNNKKVEAISFLPQEKQDKVLNDRNLNYHLLNLPQYTAIFFNQEKNDVLKIDAIRKLIAHAINKDAIIKDVLNSQAQKIEGPILPGTLGYSDTYPTYPYDIDYTKNKLDELGWKLTDYLTEEEATEAAAAKDDDNATAPTPSYPFQVRKKGNDYLEFTLTTVEQPEDIAIAKQLQKDLQQVGIKLNINSVSAEKIQRDVIKPREYEALLYGEVIGLDPDPYAFWHSSQVNSPGLNLAMFANKDVDSLLEDARKTTDENIRTEKYAKFQQIIAEEVPAIFLYNPTYTYPQTKKIKGFSTHTIIVPANRFSAINEWYIKTKRSFK